MVRCTEERFAMERMATQGFGSKKIAEALGVPLSTTGWRHGVAQHRATTWRGGWLVSCVPRICRLTSLELRLICAFCHCKMRSAFVPHHSSTLALQSSLAAQSLVFANV